MGGAVLEVLHFNGDDGARAGCLVLEVVAEGQQVGGEGAIHGVCEQHKLELHLSKET